MLTVNNLISINPPAMIDTRYIPKDLTEKRETALGVVYYNKELLKAIGYIGKQGKRNFYIKFRNLENMDRTINNFFTGLEEREATKLKWKKERKLSNALAKEQIDIGTIFSGSYGYDQTNVEFYQVTKIERGFMFLKEIKAINEYTNDMAGYCTPSVNDFMENRKELKKRLAGGVKLGCIYLSPWDGKRQYFSTYA